MYYIPLDMRRQMVIDSSAISLLMFENEGPHRQTSGIWLTYQGELYVKEPCHE